MWFFGNIQSHSAGAWGPSFPVAVFMGLCCAYIWARVKPWVHHGNNKKEYILQDLSNATSFLTNLHDTLFSNSKSPPQNTESISKAGEDVLLKRTVSRMRDGRRTTSESITGTLTIAPNVDSKEVSRLRRKLRSMGQKENVHHVSEASTLLQARLPVTSSLLSQAFEVARRAIALDPQATLQLGSYGIIMQSGTGHMRW